MDSVLYHYTTNTVFRRILKEGAILPDRTEPENEKEIPTVTFSTDPVWEKSRFRVGRLTDGQLIMMSRQLLQKYDGGLIRIVVPSSVATMDWAEMKEKTNMSSGAIRGIYDFAVNVGARTRNWYSTTKSVPESVWIAVEKFNDETETWTSLSEDVISEAKAEEVNASPVVDLPQETTES